MCQVLHGHSNRTDVWCESKTTHAARDAKNHITTIVTYLLWEKVTTEVEQCQTSIAFEDPSVAGFKCIADGRIDSYLRGEVDVEGNGDSANDAIVDNIINLDDELYDVV